jgi:hypothetical protein
MTGCALNLRVRKSTLLEACCPSHPFDVESEGKRSGNNCSPLIAHEFGPYMSKVKKRKGSRHLAPFLLTKLIDCTGLATPHYGKPCMTDR